MEEKSFVTTSLFVALLGLQFVWKENTLCFYHLFKNDDIDEVEMKKAETHSSKHFFQIKERLTEMSFLVSIILSTFFCHNSHNTSFYRNKRQFLF